MKTTEEIVKLLKKALKDESVNEDHLALFNEMYFIGSNVAKKVLREKFNCIPIEPEDMISVYYMVYVDTMRWFKLHNQKLEKFVYYFAFKVKQAIINECRYYTNNGHVLLNYAKSEDNCNDYHNQWDNDVEKEIINSIILEEYVNKLCGIQKQIMLLRLKGYTALEISEILNKPYTSILYECKKVEKHKLPKKYMLT